MSELPAPDFHFSDIWYDVLSFSAVMDTGQLGKNLQLAGMLQFCMCCFPRYPC